VTGPTGRASARDRLGVAFLIPAGALAGHAVAYSLAGPDAHAHAVPAHGYLMSLAAIAIPLAFAALVWHACQGATRPPLRSGAAGRRRPSLGPLLVAQPLLFLGQEGLEHLLAGHGMASLAHSPAVRVGVVAQAVVAGITLLLVRAARVTGRVVAATLRRTSAHRRTRPSMPRPPGSTPVVSRVRRSRVSERGPPPLLAVD
jgi:hypothetical protein